LEFTNKKQLNFTAFCSAAQRLFSFFKLRAKALYFGLPRSKNLTLANKSNSNQLCFVLPRSKKFRMCQQKQLNFATFCSTVQRKTFEMRTIFLLRNFFNICQKQIKKLKLHILVW
jgi:hypothetical protein